MAGTKEPEKPDYETIDQWGTTGSGPSSMRTLLARALWLEDRVTELEGVICGLEDVAAGRTKPLDEIRREL